MILSTEKKLLDICSSFLERDEITLIKVLLSNTDLTVTSGDKSKTIPTIIGTPQGDSLSPVLFIIYLEAALRETRKKLKTNCTNPIKEIAYADDVDFILQNKEEAEENIATIEHELGRYNLQVNTSKTEITEVHKKKDEWKKVRKLGSLLDTGNDVTRRKALAAAAHKDMFKIWVRNEKISEHRLIRIYRALVEPILLYNCGSWALTKKEEESLDAFHRRQLRRTLGIKWTEKVSTKELYDRTGCSPISNKIREARWKLFGHILRLSQEAPAQLAMTDYFKPPGIGYPGHPTLTLPGTLHNDLQSLLIPTENEHNYHQNKGKKLLTLNDLEILREQAKNK